MSLRSKISFSVLIAVLALSTVTAVAMLNRPPPLPSITGVLMPDAKPLPRFSLVDHHHRDFTRADLVGQWHIVSYGYTHCPDVCPTTLTTLARVARRIEEDRTYGDVRVLFYTVDPERDTAARLAEYVPWFHEDFVGLTQPDDDAARTFEQGLGIVSMIDPYDDAAGSDGVGEYSVSHGVAMYLLNPEGELQAVFKPTLDELGTQHFSADQIYRDYRAVRAHVAGQR